MDEQKLVDAWSQSGGSLLTAQHELSLPQRPHQDKTSAEKHQELRFDKAEARLATSRVSQQHHQRQHFKPPRPVPARP